MVTIRNEEIRTNMQSYAPTTMAKESGHVLETVLNVHAGVRRPMNRTRLSIGADGMLRKPVMTSRFFSSNWPGQASAPSRSRTDTLYVLVRYLSTCYHFILACSNDDRV